MLTLSGDESEEGASFNMINLRGTALSRPVTAIEIRE